MGQPSGERVQSIHARCGNCIVPVYEKLDLNANYTIIMSRYMSDGGDGFSFKILGKYQSFGECDINTITENIFHYYFIIIIEYFVHVCL